MNTFGNMIAISIILLIVVGCAPLQIQTSKTAEYTGLFIHKPVTADFEIEQTKVSGTATHNDLKQIGGLEGLISLAVSNALKKVNADVLIEPRYEITKKDIAMTVTVTGFQQDIEICVQLMKMMQIGLVIF